MAKFYLVIVRNGETWSATAVSARSDLAEREYFNQLQETGDADRVEILGIPARDHEHVAVAVAMANLEF